ncbi:MAG: efflux RND transporter periplasmic adaptor subunit, partial [Sedimentisphaerales bacterium]
MKIKTIIILIIVFLAGVLFRGFISSSKKTETAVPQQTEQTKEQWWTCSMHPQIRQPKPGKCPICYMDLIPVSRQNPQAAEREISFSNEALKLMDIQTTPVERKFVETQIRMVGKVDYDESKIKYITAWVPGRIDRLYVDFTGIVVSKGDHMVYLYSPQLISAQAELLQAAEAQKRLKSDSSELISRSTTEILNAAREKLRLLGLTGEQIQEVEKTGQPTDHVTITSPIGGIVIEKNANQGMYIDTGTKIYTIADLSEVWVKLDAYESDLVWLRYGQKVEIDVEAYPGEVFNGTISFI